MRIQLSARRRKKDNFMLLRTKVEKILIRDTGRITFLLYYFCINIIILCTFQNMQNQAAIYISLDFFFFYSGFLSRFLSSYCLFFFFLYNISQFTFFFSNVNFPQKFKFNAVYKSNNKFEIYLVNFFFLHRRIK